MDHILLYSENMELIEEGKNTQTATDIFIIYVTR